jgi:hypothetical protein
MTPNGMINGRRKFGRGNFSIFHFFVLSGTHGQNKASSKYAPVALKIIEYALIW